MESYFTYIVGGITIVGFILQVFDIFKKIKKTRNILTLIFLGMFLGSLISAFNQSNIKIDITFNLLMFLEIFLILVSIVSIIISYHEEDTNKREITNSVAIISFVFFVFVLIFGNLALYGLPENDKINQQELILLSKYNIEKENIERSIMYLEILKSKFPEKDIRRKEIEVKIDSLKLIQVN